MSLRERRELVELYEGAQKPGGVLFTVVRVAGSSYRQPGAQMLLLADGQMAGTLSGGCLEADLLRRAAWMVRSGAVVEHFSTAFDETDEIPYGLGCGGEIDVLAEPLDSPEASALLEAMAASLRGDEHTVATLLPDAAVQTRGTGKDKDALRRIVLDSRGDVLFASDALLTDSIVTMRRAVRENAVAVRGCQQIDTVLGAQLVERLEPVQRLVIFGAGEDARPLARLAVEMGWQPVVVDTRANRATAERFPGAHCIVSETAAGVPVRPRDATVLMTHSYAQDRKLLAELLPVAPLYLGMLGARHRSALLLQEAAADAGIAMQTALARTHAPVGLELGGEGPEAVALAIVAEVHQVLGARNGQPAVPRRLTLADAERLLRERPGSVLYNQCALAPLDQLEAVTR